MKNEDFQRLSALWFLARDRAHVVAVWRLERYLNGALPLEGYRARVNVASIMPPAAGAASASSRGP